MRDEALDQRPDRLLEFLHALRHLTLVKPFEPAGLGLDGACGVGELVARYAAHAGGQRLGQVTRAGEVVRWVEGRGGPRLLRGLRRRATTARLVECPLRFATSAGA